MSRRYVGQSTLIESNRVSHGAVSGSNVGGMIPSVVDSLQESPAASTTQQLYYEEYLGKFNAPSYQRAYGIKNETVQNVDGWGQNGIFTLNNDMFWNGPAALKIDVPIPFRWKGTILDAGVACGCMFPQIFYSWGAGFAAIKQWRFNMGGAGLYTLDRYANFIAVMSSCYSTLQRFGLMKISGGGVIAETPTVENAFGLSRPTATFGTIPNKFYYGAVAGTEIDTVGLTDNLTQIPSRIRVPVTDHWIVPYKTPHTNYNNPRIRRRPLDTKLFSEHFTVDFWLANFDEFVDTGVGIHPIKQGLGGGGSKHFCKYPGNAFYQDTNAAASPPAPCFTSRQYQNLYGYPIEATLSDQTDDSVEGVFYYGVDYNSFVTLKTIGDLELAPLASDMPFNERIGPLLTTETLPTPTIESLVASLRLTNDMLGAYDVLKTRTDQAVYYPFQHFTTQIYTTQNLCYGKLTLADYNNRVSTAFPGDESTIQKCSLPINIPVNPMTAMYIAVAREKDRRSLGVSTLGGYSPCLFWNFLHLPYLSVSYGSERIVEYTTSTSYLSEQLYEHCSPVQIPYKGGLCLRSENNIAYNDLRGGCMSTGVAGCKPAASYCYPGILRNSWIYEISLVEMEPLRNEAFFQQTPSFLGEQLNVNFTIEPSTLSYLGSYDPDSDLSLLSNYSGKQGAIENNGIYTPGCDFTGVFATVAGAEPGYPASQKGGLQADGYSPNNIDVWHMNSEPNLMVIVVYAQNALWQLNPNMSKMVFSRG